MKEDREEKGGPDGTSDQKILGWESVWNVKGKVSGKPPGTFQQRGRANRKSEGEELWHPLNKRNYGHYNRVYDRKAWPQF